MVCRVYPKTKMQRDLLIGQLITRPYRPRPLPRYRPSPVVNQIKSLHCVLHRGVDRENLHDLSDHARLTGSTTQILGARSQGGDGAAAVASAPAHRAGTVQGRWSSQPEGPSARGFGSASDLRRAIGHRHRPRQKGGCRATNSTTLRPTRRPQCGNGTRKNSTQIARLHRDTLFRWTQQKKSQALVSMKTCIRQKTSYSMLLARDRPRCIEQRGHTFLALLKMHSSLICVVC